MPLATLPAVPAGTPAVLLLSGGLDSTTVLALATEAGYAVNALTFRYGQRHGIEIDRARRIAERYQVARHVVVDIDLRLFGGSALTADLAVPKDRDAAAMHEGIPITYVPARNTIFLSFALAWAEVLGATDLLIGVNALDYSGYPDCRPEFIAAFARLATLATKAGVEGTPLEIVTPLLHLGKADIVRLGIELGLDHGLTTSCYDPAPDGRPCGRCDSCQIRAAGFAAAGAVDPRAHTG